jgi:hypothetical protein
MRGRRALSADRAMLLVLAAGYVAMLALNLPGHLSLDSVLELYEGRFRERQSWAPPFYAWVLGAFDSIRSGTGLYVAVSAAALFASLASLGALRGRTSWLGVVVAALIAVSPTLLIYQAIVWKDVLFADFAVVGMVALAWAAKLWDRPWRWAWLAASLLCLACAALCRQNGILVAALAAVALGWVAGRGRWGRGALWAIASLVVVVGASHAINLATQPPAKAPDDGVGEGLRILQNYDLLGALAADPAVPLPASTAARPKAVAALRSLSRRYYSPQTGDFTDAQPQIQDALWAIPDKAAAADWRGLILHHPLLYARDRLAVFRWVFMPPERDKCLPFYVGVDGPVNAMRRLGLTHRYSAMDGRLEGYGRRLVPTPVFSHLAYAVIALLAAGILLLRRDEADVAMAALVLGGLAFAASFFVISIACDYRYLYFLDLAAMTSLLYLAVDPALGRRGRR